MPKSERQSFLLNRRWNFTGCEGSKVVMPLPQWRVVILVLFVIASDSTSAAQESLDEKEVRHAISVGRSCHAPIIRIAESLGDFDVYVESPFARVALVAATALMMHEPLDAPGVRRAMKHGNRIWLWHKRDSRRSCPSLSNRLTASSHRFASDIPSLCSIRFPRAILTLFYIRTRGFSTIE